MSNNINTTTNITAAAPRPLDAKTYVGTGQEFATLSAIYNGYLFEGMRVYDINTNIEWELIYNPLPDSDNLNVGIINNGNGTYWKNISFGATPLFYKSNGIWINETSNNMTCTATEVITLSAITFGNIKKVQWTFQRQGGSSSTSNKETLTYIFSAGTWIIKFKIWDYFDNTLEYSYSMVSTTVGVLDIYSFTVTPVAGINGNSSITGRNYNFVIETTENIDISLIETFNIQYTTILSTNITVPLISSGTLVSGVNLTNSRKLEITNVIDFTNLLLDINTNFNLTFKLYNYTEITKTATYTSVPKIVINTNTSTISYDNTTTELNVSINLINAYDNFSSVSGVVTISGNNYNLVSNSNKLTFTYSDLISLSSGTYTCPVYLTQSVATGIGGIVETYVESTSLELLVAEPTYAITVSIKDNLPEILGGPDYIEIPTLYLYSGTTLLGTYYPETGIEVLDLSNGVYNAIAEKDYYITSEATYFTVDSAADGFTITLEPDREFTNTIILNCNPGATCTVNYDLLPDSKYEDDCDITYTISLGGSIIEGPTTKTKSTNPTTYNTHELDSSYNGHTLEVTITSYYLSDTISTTMTQEIGAYVPKWGCLPEISDYANKQVSDVVATYFTESYISSSSDLSVTTSPQLLLYQGVFGLIQEYMWFAFPDTYSVFTEYADYEENQFHPIETLFYQDTFSYGSATYNLYISMGISCVEPYFGVPSFTSNLKVR